MHKAITYRNLFLIPALLVLGVGASSCRMVKPARAEDLVAVDSLYRDMITNDTTGFANVSWQQLFTDPHLQDLMNEALRNNPDMQIAAARISKAAAAFRQSTAEFFPSLNAGFNANYQSAGGSGFGLPESYQFFSSTSWEADIWGKIRGARRASLANLYASQAFRRAVTTELVASVAINYYSLLALDAQLFITRQTVDRRTRNAEVMEVLLDNDVITGADLVLSQANRYSAEILIPDLERRIYETENLLSLLTGKPPQTVERGLLEEQDLSADLRTGVPAMLLANRPDVVEAEYRLAAFYENIRVARAGFYPSLTITARAGITETALDALFNAPVFFWNMAAGIFQPVFNYGLNRQRLRSAQADYEESKASFRRILLRAGTEVVNAMRGYETASDKISIRRNQIESLEKAVEYTNELLTYTSTTNYIDVLTSEVNLLSAQLSSVNDKLEQLQAVVELYRSLGGGWKVGE
jgi:outer membrane protein, multidrug efflux system